MKPYQPIKQEPDGDESFSESATLPLDEDDCTSFTRKRTRFRNWPLAELTFVLLVLSNLSWFMLLQSWKSPPTQLSYFGNPDKIMVPFNHDWLNLTDEGMDGIRYADDKWKGMIPPGGGSVTVTEEFVTKHGLPLGAKSMQRPGEMHYLIAGYHQLHCLSVIRDQLYEPFGITSMSDAIKRDHLLHCVENIRQALYCFLDPTLINLEMEWPYVPNGQKHVCRNRDALAAWAEERRSPMPGV
ncbi:hypothetical protein F5Y19DRAFT_312655 [Xylariaceae sp. FL1651]|nr:hypothetical protein F5Y19DRAFT_312655 [Xylariaceae sp. FL1651]